MYYHRLIVCDAADWQAGGQAAGGGRSIAARQPGSRAAKLAKQAKQAKQAK